MLVELLSLFFVCGVNARVHNLVNCPEYCTSTYVILTDRGVKEYPSNSLIAQIYLSVKGHDINRDTYYTFDGITYLLPANVIKLIKLLGPDERKYISVIIKPFETDKQSIKNITVVPELEKFFPDGSKQVDIQTIINIIQSRPKDINTLISTLTLQGIQTETDDQGRVISLIIDGYRHPFAEPIDLSFVVSIGGKHYTLPKDINLFFADVSRNPTIIKTVIDLLKQNHVQVIIENYQLKGINLNGKIYYLPKLLPIPTPIKISVDNTPYKLPDDNDKIFHSGDQSLPGKVFIELQKQGGRFTFNSDWYITDVTVSGQKVPISPTLLMISFMKKDYIIPKDLPDLALDLGKVSETITGLESVLNNYGIITKTDQSGKVISFTFNGQDYSIRYVSHTTRKLIKSFRIKLSNEDYNLPQDINKLSTEISRNPESVKGVITLLKQRNIQVIIENGKFKGIKINGEIYLLQEPVPVPSSVKITVRNIQYNLPDDNGRIFHSGDSLLPGLVLIELQKQGGHFNIDSHGYIKDVRLRDQIVPLQVTLTTIEFRGKTYTIPQDLAALASEIGKVSTPLPDLEDALNNNGVITKTDESSMITSLLFNDQEYFIKKTNTPAVKIIIGNENYTLPQDINRLFNSVSRNPVIIEGVVEVLKQNNISVIIRNNTLTGISIGGTIYTLPKPVPIPLQSFKIYLGNVAYTLPQDINKMFSELNRQPELISGFLESLKKKNIEAIIKDNQLKHITFGGKTYTPPTPLTMRSTIQQDTIHLGGEEYTIPRDFDEIFKKLIRKPELIRGFIESLKQQGIPVTIKNNQLTGIIMSANNYKPPRPLDIPQIKIMLGNKAYSLPRDIGKFLDVLYRQPELTSGFIESLKRKGIRAIIENNQLKSIGINGKSYILREPISISSTFKPLIGKKPFDFMGRRFFLPRDLQALLRFAEENGISQDALIRLLNEKGFEVTLDISGKIFSVEALVRSTLLKVIFNGRLTEFDIPSEIHKFMSHLRENNISVDKVARLLRAKGVDVRRNSKGDITDIIISGAEFSV